jgi:carboxyl-terminal processing protease
VPRRELLESALNGMLQNLDRYSSYYSADEWKQYRRLFEGNYTGIGIQVEVDAKSNRLRVLAPLIGTPAYKAGLLAGDEILEVDGQSTEGVTMDKAFELLQGRPGTTVKLNVLHPGSDQAETIEVTRAIIEPESVLGLKRNADDSWQYMLDEDAKLGYIRISTFYQNTAEEVVAALGRLQADEMKGLVLDLRADPGGLLAAAVEVSDLFVDHGTIVSTRGRNTRDREFPAHGPGTFDGFPIVILVDQNSASAAEIVAACLQDSGRAVVVGERSFGKGSVQNVLPLEGGDSFLKLTVETYYRPSGKNMHKFKDMTEADDWGVSPNDGMEVKLSPEEYAAWELDRRERDLNSRVDRPRPENTPTPKEDKQLVKAIEVLKAEIAKQSGPADPPAN